MSRGGTGEVGTHDAGAPLSLAATCRLALTLARRGLRTGTRGLLTAFACLVLGVAGIAGIASLRASLAMGLAAQGRALLGGDLAIETGALPPSAALRTWFAQRGARVSEVARLHAMLIAPSGRRILVSLEAVDHAWPLVGEPRFAPPLGTRDALAGRGLAAAPLVFSRLGVADGASVRLGREHFVLRARLLDAPDRASNTSLFGLPALISLDALPATGLVVPGSLVRYALRAVLPAGTSVAATTATLLRAFPDAGLRVRTAKDAAPGLARFLDRTALFMTLVALTALLVGAVGVANGVGAWAEARLPDIATLRSLGASPRLVAASLLAEAFFLSLPAVAIGVAIGAAVPWLVAFLLGSGLAIPARLALYPGPLAIAAGFGLATALLCMLWPILRAARTPPASLFRQSRSRERAPLSLGAIIVSAVLLAVLVVLAIAATGAWRFVLFFALAGLLSLVLLGGAGTLLAWAARRVTGRGPVWFRLGIKDLSRPGTATPIMVISIGLGLAALASVALIQGNLHAAFTEEIPKGAPTFYFIDIQNNELPTFERLMHRLPGVETFATVPMLRARVVAVNGTPAAKIAAVSDTRWALNQDLGLTYAAHPPPGNRIVAGRWWPADYQGQPLLSLGARLAKGWGVKVGEPLTLNVLGRNVTLRVTNLRTIPWQRLGLNFFLVASPGLLEGAPHTNIATVRVAPGGEAAVLEKVTNALPNASAIEVAGVIASIGAIFSHIASAGSALAGLTLASGILVLGVAIAAEERRRTRQAVILKVLGATRSEIRAAWLTRFTVMGAIAGALAAVIATAASFAVVHTLMHGHWVFLPIPLAVTLIAGVLLMLLAGVWATARALRAPPARWLARDA